MARSISNHEWQMTRTAVDGRLAAVRGQQQRLFRVGQALWKGDLKTALSYVEDGAPIDQPLEVDEARGAVPGVASLFPAEWGAPRSVTLLALAAWKGELPLVEWLLRQGASATTTMDDGRDAAWFATAGSGMMVYRHLMEEGASPRLRLTDSTRRTRLMGAVISRNIEVVGDLLGRKVNVNERDALGRTALHHNLLQDPYDETDGTIGRMLLEFGGNPNMEDNEGIPSHILARSPEQQALMEGYELAKVMDAVRQKIEPKAPEPEFDPASDPGVPQLKRMPKSRL